MPSILECTFLFDILKRLDFNGRVSIYNIQNCKLTKINNESRGAINPLISFNKTIVCPCHLVLSNVNPILAINLTKLSEFYFQVF